MPYKVFARGGKYAVYKLGAEDKPVGDPLGTHDTEEEARAQQSALYASENKSAVKFVEDSDSAIIGLGVPYGGPFNGNDLAGEHFSPRTNLCLDWFPPDGRPILYHHALNPAVGTQVVGRIKSYETREDGLWIKGELDKSAQYFEQIRSLVQAGKLYLSSGSMRHLVQTDRRSGEVLVWPLIEISLTPTPANVLAQVSMSGSASDGHYEIGFSDASKHYEAAGLKATFDSAYKAIWSAAMVNDLPDSAFAFVEDGGEKDEDGNTTPRSLRHFPYKDSSGGLDAPHVRNALARIPQSDLPEEAKSRALEVIQAAAKKLSIGDYKVLDSVAADALIPEDMQGKPVQKKPAMAKMASTAMHKMLGDVLKEMSIEMSPEDMDAMVSDMDSSMSEADMRAEMKKRLSASKMSMGMMREKLADMAGDMGMKPSADDMDKMMSSMDLSEDMADEDVHTAMQKELQQCKEDAAKKAVSWEDVRSEVQGLLYKQIGPGPDPSYANYLYVRSTFPDHVIAEINEHGSTTICQVSFARDSEGHVTSIGRPVEVEVEYIPKADVPQMPLGAQSEMVKSYVDALLERTKDLHQSRLKEGRMLSSTNRERLQRCLDTMRDACDEMAGLLDSTVPQPAKAATVRQRQRAKMLELYAATL